MRHFIPSALNTIHFYPTETEIGAPHDCNFMEREDLYWQPIAPLNYQPLSFASRKNFSSNLGLAIHTVDGKHLSSVEVLSKFVDDLIFWHVLKAIPQDILNENIGNKLVLSLYKIFSYDEHPPEPIYRAYVEVKSFEWLKENGILLSTQLNNYKFGALDTTRMGHPITWYSWFPGAIKTSELVVEDNTHAFRDQAWGESLVSRRINKVHAIRIGDTKGVPAWMYEKVQAYLSCKFLYLNDIIRVTLSSGEAPSFAPQASINRGNISFGLSEVGDNLFDENTEVLQLDGSAAYRRDYLFDLVSDSSYHIPQAFKSRTTIPINNKTLVSSRNELRGAYLEYKSGIHNNNLTIQSTIPIVSELGPQQISGNTVNLLSIGLLETSGVDYHQQHVTDTTVYLRDYKRLTGTNKVFIIFAPIYEDGLDFKYPIGLGLLHDPVLAEITFEHQEQKGYVGFIPSASSTEVRVNYLLPGLTQVRYLPGNRRALPGTTVLTTWHCYGTGDYVNVNLTETSRFYSTEFPDLNVSSGNARRQYAKGARNYGTRINLLIGNLMFHSDMVVSK